MNPFDIVLTMNNICHCRVGLLYGYFSKENNVKVEFIYEPPQECTDSSFQFLDDPHKVVKDIAHVYAK